MNQLYNPFEQLDFAWDKCFFTGRKVNPDTDKISIIPEWIIKEYQLQDKSIPMLAGNSIKYAEIKMPCDPDVFEKYIKPLEDEIAQAFQSGYKTVHQLDPLRLFQWIGKFMYGMLYNDILFGMRQYAHHNREFTVSSYLVKKFSGLHQMLQSLMVPMDFEVTPWSLVVVPIESTKDIFNYKDETKNINFSLAMKDFGIVMCLQDAGKNLNYHSDLLNKINSKVLHPIQFEELWSRFLYSNYLLYPKPTFAINNIEGKVRVMEETPAEPTRFLPWEDKMFAQVLSNYWKPWGLEMADIYNFPNSLISYLIDEYTNEFIDREKINQPF